MPEHSKEPWSLSEPASRPEYNGSDGHHFQSTGEIVVDADNEIVVGNTICFIPNMRRAIKCVNPMAGVPDPEKLMAAVRAFVLCWRGIGTTCDVALDNRVDDIAAALKGEA